MISSLQAAKNQQTREALLVKTEEELDKIVRSGYGRKDQCHTKACVQTLEHQTFVVIRLTGPKQNPAVSPDRRNQFFKKHSCT